MVEDNKCGFFVIDCETDGLYGEFLTVAVVVTDENFNIINEKYWGNTKAIKEAKDPWVIENVISHLGDFIKCESEDELFEKVWKFWIENRKNRYAIADVCFPVENRFFSECITKKIAERAFEGPYPLLDLSSILYAKGIDPLKERAILSNSNPLLQHNAIEDTRMIVKILKKTLGDEV